MRRRAIHPCVEFYQVGSATSFTRSGNPGYVTGLAVVAGTLQVNAQLKKYLFIDDFSDFSFTFSISLHFLRSSPLACTILNFFVLLCSILYSTASYCAIMYFFTVLFSTFLSVLYFTTFSCVILEYTLWPYVVMYFTVLYIATLSSIVQYLIVFDCTVLYCPLLYCTVL